MHRGNNLSSKKDLNVKYIGELLREQEFKNHHQSNKSRNK